MSNKNNRMKKLRSSRIIFDTCVILELYRKSPDITKLWLDVLEQAALDIWIPHQVLKEFERNKKRVKKSEHMKFKKIPNNMKTLLKSTKITMDKQILQYKKLGFPNITSLQTDISDLFGNLNICLDEYVKKANVYDMLSAEILNQNLIDDFVDSLKNNKHVGEKLMMSELIKILEEGEIRYKNKIPPGYMDDPIHNKDSKKEGIDIYGDLIMWMQSINNTNETKKDVIFVTEDNKEDWFEDGNPRVELLEEFEEKTSNSIQICSFDNFTEMIIDAYDLSINSIENLVLTIRAEDYVQKLMKTDFSSTLEKKIRHELGDSGLSEVRIINILQQVYLQSISSFETIKIEVNFNKETKYALYNCEVVMHINGVGIDTDYYNKEVTFDGYLHGFCDITREVDQSINTKLSNNKCRFSNLDVIGMSFHVNEWNFTEDIEEEY